MIDTGGYRERWVVPCADLFGRAGRAIVAVTADRRALQLILPAATVHLDADAADELARDIQDAARRARGH
jgi:hypothetical protein